MTLSLVSRAEVAAHPDLALALAAREFSGRLGYVLIGVAAVASTASAINATMFSTALFATGMSSEGLFPDRLAEARETGVPARALLAIGVPTVLFTVYDSLAAITEFASLSFIAVFGIVNAIAYTQRSGAGLVPLVELVGTGTFLALFTWHLYAGQFGVFVLVLGIAAVLLLVEGLYFERREVEARLRTVEKRL